MTSLPTDEEIVRPSSTVSAVAAAVLVFYALGAIAVHHCWPLYVFDMYAFPAPTTTSRLTLLDEQGRPHDVRSIKRIRCAADAQVILQGPACGAWWTVEARDNEVWRVLRDRHWSGKGRNARLVRRAWSWAQEGETTKAVATDCAVVDCQVQW